MVIAMTASAIDAFAPTCQKERGETLMASCNTKKIETRYDYLDIGSGPRVEINQRLMSRSHTHTEDQHNTQDTQCTARERGFRMETAAAAADSWWHLSRRMGLE